MCSVSYEGGKGGVSMRAGATTPACVLERGEKGREESRGAQAESATITTAAERYTAERGKTSLSSETASREIFLSLTGRGV